MGPVDVLRITGVQRAKEPLQPVFAARNGDDMHVVGHQAVREYVDLEGVIFPGLAEDPAQRVDVVYQNSIAPAFRAVDCKEIRGTFDLRTTIVRHGYPPW